MRHARGYRRLNRTHEHRKALLANMAGSLIEHEQIKTTLPKAKELRRIIEKMITLANAAICTPAVRPRPAEARPVCRQTVRHSWAALQRPPGRLCPRSEGRFPLWRHGADGDHRVC